MCVNVRAGPFVFLIGSPHSISGTKTKRSKDKLDSVIRKIVQDHCSLFSGGKNEQFHHMAKLLLVTSAMICIVPYIIVLYR